MFNIFLCFSVFYIHTKLISPQYMPGDHAGQSCEKGLRAHRETYPPLIFSGSQAFHSHKQEGLETNFPSFPGVPFRRRKLSGNNFLPSAIPPYGLPENIHFRQES